MPRSKQHKQQSREKILKCAIKLFTGQGFDNTSITEIMAAAEMTHGAFYAHFSSKQQLYKEAINSIIENGHPFAHKPDNIDDNRWLAFIINGYLSEKHLQQKVGPCPLAFLVTDVAIRDDSVRDTFTNGYKYLNSLISHYTSGHTHMNKTMVITTLLIGGVAIARAVNDRKVSQDILHSCQQMCASLLQLENATSENEAIPA